MKDSTPHPAMSPVWFGEATAAFCKEKVGKPKHKIQHPVKKYLAEPQKASECSELAGEKTIRVVLKNQLLLFLFLFCCRNCEFKFKLVNFKTL